MCTVFYYIITCTCNQSFAYTDDYVPVRVNLTLESGEARACINVSIIDDDEVELSETFGIRLVPLSGFVDVKANMSTAIVSIVDDDGQCEKTLHVMCIIKCVYMYRYIHCAWS